MQEFYLKNRFTWSIVKLNIQDNQGIIWYGEIPKNSNIWDFVLIEDRYSIRMM